jgi:hypothetical protein
MLDERAEVTLGKYKWQPILDAKRRNKRVTFCSAIS